MSFDDVVQDLAEDLGKPLVVLDSDLNVAAFSIHETDVDRSRLSIALSRVDVESTRAAAQEYGLFTAADSVHIPADQHLDSRIFIPLRHKRQLMGFAYFFPDPSSEIDSSAAITQLESWAPELGMQLALRRFDDEYRLERAKRLLAGLLDNSADVRSTAANELRREDLIADAEHYAILLYAAPTTSPVSGAQLAVDETLSFTERSTTVKLIGAMLGDEGVLLFPRAVKRDRLLRILDNQGLERVYAGVGNPRAPLSQVVESYREARLSWEAARRDPARYGRAAYWDDLGLDKLLMQLPLDTLTADELPTGVQRLVESPNGPELAVTLEHYLNAGGDIQKAARALHIHRSTMYYRMERIRDTTGCDLADGQVRRDMHTGLRVAHLARLLVDT